MKSPIPGTIVVALSDMTWAACEASMEQGHAPAIAAITRNGVRARVIPSAVTGPPLWPTIATGVDAAQHGVITVDEPWSGGLRPTGRASWRSAPYWERLEASGIPTIGVGWPFSRPGAAWRGTQVDERFSQPSGRAWDDWYLPREICPEPLRDILRETRVHPADVAGDMLLPFVPALDSVDQLRDRRLVDIALAIAGFATCYGGFSSLLHRKPWRLATLYSDLLGRLAAFEGAAEPFGQVATAGWALLDNAIGALSKLLGGGGTLILFSPGRANEAGVLFAFGPGLPPGVELPPVSVLDVAPSLLARFGLGDATLAGTPRLNAPASLRDASPVDRPERDPAPSAADLARAARFGYRPPMPPDGVLARHFVERAEALLLVDPAAAATLAERALAIVPDFPSALGLLAAAKAAAGDFASFPDIADRLAAVAPAHPWVPLIRGAYHASRREAGAAMPLLREAEAIGGPAEWMRIAAVWLMLRRPAEARRLFDAVQTAKPDSIDALLGVGLTSGTDWIAAEQAFRRALSIDSANRQAREGLDRILRRTGRLTAKGAQAAAIA